tara:strand:- start:135 stop:338 length:204 start_codon:yes stop_codon:yes gene_type:complete
MIYLHSVGFAMSPESLQVFPLNQDDSIDHWNPCHIEDVCDEWFAVLSDDDHDLVVDTVAQHNTGAAS